MFAVASEFGVFETSDRRQSPFSSADSGSAQKVPQGAPPPMPIEQFLQQGAFNRTRQAICEVVELKEEVYEQPKGHSQPQKRQRTGNPPAQPGVRAVVAEALQQLGVGSASSEGVAASSASAGAGMPPSQVLAKASLAEMDACPPVLIRRQVLKTAVDALNRIGGHRTL